MVITQNQPTDIQDSHVQKLKALQQQYKNKNAFKLNEIYHEMKKLNS